MGRFRLLTSEPLRMAGVQVFLRRSHYLSETLDKSGGGVVFKVWRE